MFFDFFKAKKADSLNLSQLFDKFCSLPFIKTRSKETHILANIIKENAILNCNKTHSNLASLSKEQLASDLDKITNVYNAIDEWMSKRENKSERVNMILDFRNNVLKPSFRNIFSNYEAKGGQFEERWSADSAKNKVTNSPRLGYSYNRCFSLMIGLPFITQVFDAMPDLLSLIGNS